MYNFPLLWAAANQQQQDFLFTAFVSKPRSAPTAVHVYFCALVTFVTMYIHEVGGYAAFVDVRPAYIRTWLPGPFTTTTALPLSTCQMEKSDSVARWKKRILLPDGKTCCIHTGKSFSDVEAVYWQTESTPRRQLRVFHSFISLKSGSTLPVGWGDTSCVTQHLCYWTLPPCVILS